MSTYCFFSSCLPHVLGLAAIEDCLLKIESDAKKCRIERAVAVGSALQAALLGEDDSSEDNPIIQQVADIGFRWIVIEAFSISLHSTIDRAARPGPHWPH